jgi:hypothetical protein
MPTTVAFNTPSYGDSTNGNFNISAGSTPGAAGSGSVTGTVTITPINGWKGPVNMTYSTNQSASVSCSPSSETVSVPDTGNVIRYVAMSATSGTAGVILDANGVNADNSEDVADSCSGVIIFP